jgi:hypothetical protein
MSDSTKLPRISLIHDYIFSNFVIPKNTKLVISYSAIEDILYREINLNVGRVRIFASLHRHYKRPVIRGNYSRMFQYPPSIGF